MYNAHTDIVAKLSTILPTYYELFLDSECEVPCISYLEAGNYIDAQGDTVDYSRVSYTIKVWANDIETIQNNAADVDEAMRELGFKRTGTVELADMNSTMIQKIMTYQHMSQELYY